MKEIGGFFARLTSRKFLITLFGIAAVTVYPEQATAICTLIATFVGAEGIADSVSRYSVEKTKQSSATLEHDKALLAEDDEDEITGVIEPGNVSTPTPTNNFGGDAPL